MDDDCDFTLFEKPLFVWCTSDDGRKVARENRAATRGFEKRRSVVADRRQMPMTLLPKGLFILLWIVSANFLLKRS
jgi:hypothetical protein